jgi:hypothetical protein
MTKKPKSAVYTTRIILVVTWHLSLTPKTKKKYTQASGWSMMYVGWRSSQFESNYYLNNCYKNATYHFLQTLWLQPKHRHFQPSFSDAHVGKLVFMHIPGFRSARLLFFLSWKQNNKKITNYKHKFGTLMIWDIMLRWKIVIFVFVLTILKRVVRFIKSSEKCDNYKFRLMCCL